MLLFVTYLHAQQLWEYVCTIEVCVAAFIYFFFSSEENLQHTPRQAHTFILAKLCFNT